MTTGNAVPGNALIGNVVLFGRTLRRAGLSIDSSQIRRFAEVLALLGFDRRGDVKAAGRAVFVRRREERAVYDPAFDLFWRASTARGAVSAALPRLRESESPPAEARFGPDAPPGTDVTDVVDDSARVGASVQEALRTADFAGLTPLLCVVGGDEILLDDAIRLVRNAGTAAIDAMLFIAAGMQHVFPIWAGAFPEADAAIALIGNWVRAR